MAERRKLIAIIDDDASVRTALERQIRIMGYRCQVFANAEAFLAVAAVCGADCVLSDVHMNGLTGLQLAVHPLICKLNLPVLIISGSSVPLIEEPARMIGAGFLAKPFRSEQLLELIVDTIGPPIVEGDD